MEAAKEAGKTRAQMSMRIAKEDMNGGIVVIGNAPTALLEIMEMVREGITKPALVIGIPVGFVSAVESKDELSKTAIPFITNQGRKGGSPCAAAIVNALYKLLRQRN
jgi:precorrin-8X/cobalt-precorrin-8 methylmutase